MPAGSGERWWVFAEEDGHFSGVFIFFFFPSLFSNRFLGGQTDGGDCRLGF